MTGLTTGESSTFKIKAACGAPAFKVAYHSTATNQTFDVSYMEYSSTQKKDGENVSSLSTAISDRKNDSPKEGEPARNQTFKNSGDQGDKSG